MKKTFLRTLALVLAVFAILALKQPVQAADTSAFAPVFNSTYYADVNPDLKAIFGTNEDLLFHHFITSGMAEGRQGSAEFNVHVYKESNADLKAVFGEDLTSYYLHYINSGKAEGRIASTTSPQTANTPATSPSSQAAPLATAIYNPSNSLAVSPLAPKPAESLKSYKKYWIRSSANGYPLKVKFDPNAIAGSTKVRRDGKIVSVPLTYDSHMLGYRNPYNIIYDQTFSYRPEASNAYLWAYLDFCIPVNGGRSSDPENFFISPSALPLVELAKSKTTVAVSNPSWEAFCKGFNVLWSKQKYNKEYDPKSFSAPDLRASGQSILVDVMTDLTASSGINFGLKYRTTAYSAPNNCWCLTITYNEVSIPTELMWYAIRNCIRLVDPDAEIIYQQIYEHFYGGNHVFPSFDTWVPVGNSHVMVPTPADISYYKYTEGRPRSVNYYFR